MSRSHLQSSGGGRVTDTVVVQRITVSLVGDEATSSASLLSSPSLPKEATAEAGAAARALNVLLRCEGSRIAALGAAPALDAAAALALEALPFEGAARDEPPERPPRADEEEALAGGAGAEKLAAGDKG